MNRLLAIPLLLFASNTALAQFDTLHTEALNFTYDTLVKAEFYTVSLGLTDYTRWSEKGNHRKSKKYYISLDSSQTQFFNHLSDQGIEVTNVTTQSESLVPQSWNSPEFRIRHITFDVESKAFAKQVYDSFKDNGVRNIAIQAMISDSLMEKITTTMQKQASIECSKRAMKSARDQGCDSILKVFFSYQHSRYQPNAGQYITPTITTQSITYNDIRLYHYTQFNYKLLRRIPIKSKTK